LNEPDFWMNVIHPEDREWTVALCHKQRVQGRDYELVYRCRRADNRVIWLRDRAFVVQDEQGRIHKRRGLMVDITPIKQAEIEFQSRIHSLSAIAQLSQQAISATPISTLMDKAASLVAQTLQVEYCQVLELLPDGNALKLTAGVGWREGLVGNTLIDANVNTQAGYTLQTRQPVVIEDLSSESRFLGSPLLHDHNIMSGMSVIIPEASSVRVGGTWDHPDTEGGGVTNISQQLPSSSSSSLSASPAPQKNRPFGVLAAYTSRQRVLTRSEVDFLQSVANVLAAAIQYQQADAAVDKVQSQLAQTTVALEKCTREFDQFAYIASHDLKAPLRAIANLSEWIEEDICYQLNEENLHQLQLLRGRVRRLEVLIEGLLQYSRAGRLNSDPERIDVAALLTHVINTLNPPSEFTCEISPGMPVLGTERLPLQQVFIHLIDNAIKHHPSTAGTVKISVQEQPDVYEFAVTDDGAGIAPEFHERVFGIFQTLQVKDRVESAGVGLAIAKKIVEGKGGTIRLESHDDGGATFYFTWPKRLSQV
ncbi:MAG: ATP-binding protein, partial [Cyanobacteriota bacterium]